MKIIFFVLLLGLIGCDKEVVDSEGKIHTVLHSFELPNGWRLGEKIGHRYFTVYDTEGKKWLLQENYTGHGSNITLSKME